MTLHFPFKLFFFPNYFKYETPKILFIYCFIYIKPLINVEDNIIEYRMGDVETKVVPEGGTSRNANQNEEHDIPDVDLDMDYDM